MSGTRAKDLNGPLAAAEFLFRQEPDEEDEEEDEDEDSHRKHDENEEEEEDGYFVKPSLHVRMEYKEFATVAEENLGLAEA